jgi:NhaP-type Na+/H+ or K+/H+ antiporter
MGPGTAEPTEEAQIQQAMTKFFVLPAFVFVGLAIPWDAWLGLGWRGIMLAGLILLRRPPVIVGLSQWFRPLHTRKETVFSAWFGPIGISTLFYATLAERQTGLDSIWPVASLLLCASLVAHGLSATPISRRIEGGESGGGSTPASRS